MVTASTLSLASLLSLVSLGVTQKCTLQFDGRVPSNTALASFDATNKFFTSNNVVGQGIYRT